jgi:hypothetical protein
MWTVHRCYQCIREELGYTVELRNLLYFLFHKQSKNGHGSAQSVILFVMGTGLIAGRGGTGLKHGAQERET